jgi:hypothetical protein
MEIVNIFHQIFKGAHNLLIIMNVGDAGRDSNLSGSDGSGSEAAATVLRE